MIQRAETGLIRPIIGITMGDPVGIGAEVLLKALQDEQIYQYCRPLVFGDRNILQKNAKLLNLDVCFHTPSTTETGLYRYRTIDIVPGSDLDTDQVRWGVPSQVTGKAMLDYILQAIESAKQDRIHGVVTAPVNKVALKMAGSPYPGHTEIFARQTRTPKVVMMLAGSKLRVVLVTIHVSLKEAVERLSVQEVFETIRITKLALQDRFGIDKPKIAVAGLNPHAGEEGLFGSEEQDIIQPAVHAAGDAGIDVSGPFPPDTVFYQAAQGRYDTVVCMYHDQGLIPFKMIHFMDGVNTTLGLPIIRTSVDHGTAYEIAGEGQADSGSMVAAIRMAAEHARNVYKSKGER